MTKTTNKEQQRAAARPVRRSDMTVQELDGEALVYDPVTADTHRLNETAYFIWRSCDGRSTSESVAEQLHEAPGEFGQRWSIMVEATAEGSAAASASAGVSVGSGNLHIPPGTAEFPLDQPDASEMLREQLRNTREDNAGNPQMQKMLDEMLRKLDESD